MPEPRQNAYDAVYGLIRSLPADTLPTSAVERNALIWHAVHAALDAVLPADPTAPRPDGRPREPLPTVIHETPERLREQRARLIASTGMTEDVLRERGENFALYPEHRDAWNTLQGIDYLLDGQ